ncbi:conjugative transfer ATPase [Xenorhabdus bovienii]|uniref:conjugative transfer ATPase n=1 Tax=Xenorhabdus bovienii TaxID=40576 RepID=UPI00237D0906|nr:conjugative transfer ATPase [Xenorhabdus bovienii]MDE1486552.1 conjugative transfer ATPase [Xenorhabdus bovienii]MDE1496044.1 conjugative transfer ATPase [Xenorhabdus bovienii]MDE9446610.1 conjugative transfer ATPase [Xenorhabdus bovienii]MDE9474072.1 conjugative transfer ATPase [Xenorhabdus bovienii]MDE9477172.1 conjugative transfer ATPase [Xenorhabdus bovienii]
MNIPKALNRPSKLREADEAAIYQANPSIIDYLPWVEYLEDGQCLLLDDGISVGAVYRIEPIATEGRPAERLTEIRDQLEDAIQDSLEEDDISPWVVQFFCQDDDDPAAYLNTLRGYVKPWATGTPFTDAFLTESERHLTSIARPDGIFQDSLITGQSWRGQQRQTRMVVYRWLPDGRRSHVSNPALSAVAALNQVCERLVSSLAAAGVIARRQHGGQIHRWLLRHFNPAPDWGMAKADFYHTVSYEAPIQSDLPVSNDFAESLWFTPPVSDPEAGVWWFDGLPHKAIPVERLRRPPEPGTLTGEVKRGDNINALMDMMPAGTVVSLTIVAQAQDRLEEDFTRLAKNAVGENTESLRVRQDVQEVKALLGRRHKLYRSALTFLVRGKDVADLNHRMHQLSSTLLTAGLQPVRPEFSVSPLNAWLRALPMCFNPQKDKKHWYSRLTWVQHLAGLLPVTGRSTGTGHPGFSFFNRGGAPLTFDPMNKQDRTQNAHLLLFGPTGAGKSATLCALLIQLMAIHRPRLFIVEAGNSFGLLADYYESLGLTVNKIGIRPGCGVSLALFADAHQLLQLSPEQLRINEADIPETDEAQEEGDEQRDILGEMEIAARLMITGGEKREEERLTRSDRGLIREAIMQAAQTSFDESRQMVASDLQNALYAIARNHRQDEHGQPLITAYRRARADEMASAMSMFTQGFEGELFNRPGTPWPEVDVTLIDLGTLARENYSAQMALAMVSLINKVNNLAERDQYQDRELQLVIDEGHITTTNPLLSPYMTKVVKMWRKLGAWLWLATQNLADYPDTAEKMLNMAEWWLCLTMPPDEVEQIARFKKLTEEQKAVLLSASKLPRCYTEGVVLAKKIEALFRVVPPSLYLALGMTEKEEKAERRALMRAHQCSELEAAVLVARKMDIARGLKVDVVEHSMAKETG